MKRAIRQSGMGALLTVALLCLWAASASAGALVPGITGPSFTLATGQASISTPDGDSLLIWGYRDVAGNTPVQYPGPTLIVTQGQTVTVTLTNTLPRPVSIVFPGQGEVTATGGTPGLLTREAAPGGGTVTYSFVASSPGTYMYHSGTRPDLQVEMGLLGALIVRPTNFDPNNAAQRTAYGNASTAFDHEYLFLLSEMDPVIHDLVDFGFLDLVDNTTAYPVFWFINGRNSTDTLFANNAGWLPNQPYSSLARTFPGEKVLLRLIGGGRDMHSFHPHGNHSLLVARDGRMLESNPGVSGPNLATADFTFTVMPGATYDALFSWTGEKLGWDIYGTGSDHEHDCNGISVNAASPASAGFDPVTKEYCPDHGKPIPVLLTGLQDVTIGGWYSGSPFLGSFGDLPPGEGGLNPNAGLFFMWHSHNEKELTNFDIFPGGMMTFVIIEPRAPGVTIP